MDLDSIGPWLDRQKVRGMVALRVKCGGPRSLTVRGTIDTVESDGAPRSTDEIVAELREDVASNGWPSVVESWGVDALDADGKVLKSTQDTSKEGPAATARGVPQQTASRSDWEITVGALVRMAEQAQELAKSTISELGREREERRRAEAEAMDARAAAMEAEAAAAMEAAAAAMTGEEGEDPVKARGVDALEKLAETFMKKAGRAPTKEEILAMVRDPKNRAMVRGLATDPAFLEAMTAAVADEDDGPAPEAAPS